MPTTGRRHRKVLVTVVQQRDSKTRAVIARRVASIEHLDDQVACCTLHCVGRPPTWSGLARPGMPNRAQLQVMGYPRDWLAVVWHPSRPLSSTCRRHTNKWNMTTCKWRIMIGMQRDLRRDHRRLILRYLKNSHLTVGVDSWCSSASKLL